MEAARYNFFLGNRTSVALETALSLITCAGFAQRHILASFSKLLLLMLVLTMWSATRSFSIRLESNIIFARQSAALKRGSQLNLSLISFQGKVYPKQASGEATKWKSIHHDIQFLEKLAKLVNKAIGNHMTYFLMEAVIYYATHFDYILVERRENKDWGKVLHLFFFLGSAYMIIIFAADVCYQVCMY